MWTKFQLTWMLKIPAYVETEFKDVQPNGPMVEYRDSERDEDLTEEYEISKAEKLVD